MGMCAEVVAIGPFTEAVVEHLEYPPEYYERTRTGIQVVRVLFGIEQGSGLSRELAALLGVSDAWDFNQHQLDPSRFDAAGLREFARSYPDYESDVDAILAFAEAGFGFHFLPNG